MTKISIFRSIRIRYILLITVICASLGGRVQGVDDIMTLEAYTVYSGKIKVIDGITGEDYHSANEVVMKFSDNFNKLLLAYHKKLLEHELKHMHFRLTDGKAFEAELSALADSFGIKGFHAEQDNWMVREKAITHRLATKPFFKIQELIVWELDQLEHMKMSLPNNKYAKDIRYNKELGKWERRVTTEWKVNYRAPSRNRNDLGRYVSILKEQGLNLDTNCGYHFIDRGLTKHIHSGAFSDVKLTYPIFLDREMDAEEQLLYLQGTFIENLAYLYDPFSWVARRSTRFRGGFARELRKYFENRRYKIKDRDWFNPVICQFLSDVVTMKRHGVKEIYSFYTHTRFELSENILGNGLDLLNWNSDENRIGKPEKNRMRELSFRFENPYDARFVLLDAYMRYGDRFVEVLRARLLALERNGNAQEIIKSSIEEVSNIPSNIYITKAFAAQIAEIDKFRKHASCLDDDR